MSIADLCNEIESFRMAAEVNVASSFRAAIGIVRKQLAVRALAEVLGRPGMAERIYQRILDLSYQATDHRYENPNDTALTAYLLLLASHDRKLGLVASSAVRHMPDLWWAYKLAKGFLERSEKQNDRAGETSTPVAANVNSGESVFVADPRLLWTTGPPNFLRHFAISNLPVNAGAQTSVWGEERGLVAHNVTAYELELEAVAA